MGPAVRWFVRSHVCGRAHWVGLRKKSANPPSVVVRDKEASVAVPAYIFSAESGAAEVPLTSEPPLPAADPLTSEPPLAGTEAMTSEHADAEADPTGLYEGPVAALSELPGL